MLRASFTPSPGPLLDGPLLDGPLLDGKVYVHDFWLVEAQRKFKRKFNGSSTEVQRKFNGISAPFRWDQRKFNGSSTTEVHRKFIGSSSERSAGSPFSEENAKVLPLRAHGPSSNMTLFRGFRLGISTKSKKITQIRARAVGAQRQNLRIFFRKRRPRRSFRWTFRWKNLKSPFANYNTKIRKVKGIIQKTWKA